jgi:hypothetical protein
MYQSAPRNNEAVNVLIAHPVTGERLHCGKWQALLDQPGKITVRSQGTDAKFGLYAAIQHRGLSPGMDLGRLCHKDLLGNLPPF